VSVFSNPNTGSCTYRTMFESLSENHRKRSIEMFHSRYGTTFQKPAASMPGGDAQHGIEETISA